MLNKKSCRACSAAPALDPNHGLLHAEQVDYIVRTAIKIIDHHRTLVLYIYDRQWAAAGDSAPTWVMFQGKDNYITLERDSHGATKWRTVSFERLGKPWGFVYKCAFYSAKDRKRVTSYFHADDGTGFAPLIHAQNSLLKHHKQVRQRERDRNIQARMKGLHALPRGLQGWLRKAVIPAYFFYDHARKGNAGGVCSACGHTVSLTGVKHNAKGVCPRCGRALTMKCRGRRGRLYDRETCQVLQQTGPDEIVVRIIKAYCSYEGDVPQIRLRENARQFIQLDQNGAALSDRYYFSYENSKWKRGNRPVMFPYQYSFEADTCGHVYSSNLPDALLGTPWEYCPVHAFYEHFREPMQLYPFLTAYLEHPKLEHLVKVGFYNLVSDLVYRSCCGCTLDETQNRTHRLLGVAAEDVPLLRNLDIEAAMLGPFQKYCKRNLKGRQMLLRWQLEQKVARDILPALEHMTAHKFMRYLDGQYSFLRLRKTQYGSLRYRSMQELVTEYRDYLDMCQKQHYDMSSSFVLYPKDLQKAHDKAARRIKLKADAQMRRDFQAAYQQVMNHLDYEQDGMKIVYPATPEEIAAEGNALHHCVGGYVDRVARKECMILFLRRCEDLSKPFYTVEIQGQKAVQVRGMQNAEATPEVQAFIFQWERQVLQRQDLEPAA